MWHRIFSISFTWSKFDETWKRIVFIIYVIDLSTKNKMWRRGFIFFKKSKIQVAGNRQKKFQLFHFRNFEFFLYGLFQKLPIVSSEHSFKYFCRKAPLQMFHRPKNTPLNIWAILVRVFPYSDWTWRSASS